MPRDAPENYVRTLVTSIEIVEIIQQQDGASTAEIAEETDRAISTVHKHLHTLHDHGFLIKEGREYRIGLKFLDYGGFAKHKHPLTSVSKEVLKDLAQDTEELVWLIVEEHGMGVYLSYAAGKKAVQTVGRQGVRAHLHQLAAGKCILAHLPDNRVREIIEQHGMPSSTDSTISNSSELLEELENVREQGYAYNIEEEIEGISAVSAPVIHNGDVLGGVSIAGPAARFENQEYAESLRDHVIETANTIELRLKY